MVEEATTEEVSTTVEVVATTRTTGVTTTGITTTPTTEAAITGLLSNSLHHNSQGHLRTLREPAATTETATSLAPAPILAPLQ